MTETALFAPLCADLLQSGQAVRFSATGGSMRPTIRDGETVVVEPVHARDIRRGDVVLFRGARGLTAHRVCGIGRAAGASGEFVIKSDNGPGDAEPVEGACILGRVTRVERLEAACDPGSIGAQVNAHVWHILVRVRHAAHRARTALYPKWRHEESPAS